MVKNIVKYGIRTRATLLLSSELKSDALDHSANLTPLIKNKAPFFRQFKGLLDDKEEDVEEGEGGWGLVFLTAKRKRKSVREFHCCDGLTIRFFVFYLKNI